VMCGRGFRQNEQTKSDYENTVEHASHECLLRKDCCWPNYFVYWTRILLRLFQICMFRRSSCGSGSGQCPLIVVLVVRTIPPPQVFLQVLMSVDLKGDYALDTDNGLR
jgi:hypothetical protein